MLLIFLLINQIGLFEMVKLVNNGLLVISL